MNRIPYTDDIFSEGWSNSAPVIEAIYIKPRGMQVPCKLKSLIDTGADITVLPRDVIFNVLRLIPQSISEIKFTDEKGNVTLEPCYYVAIKSDDFYFSLVKVIGWDKNFALVGRDILNRLEVLLKGNVENKYFEIK